MKASQHLKTIQGQNALLHLLVAKPSFFKNLLYNICNCNNWQQMGN